MTKRFTFGVQLSVILSFLVCLSANLSRAENWARFRGPGGKGISHQKGLPVRWTKSDYKWTTRLPGKGHGSPCVWGDHIFLTSALEKGQVRVVLDVNPENGRIRWITRFDSQSHPKHNLNSYASCTPASDGERVYAYFSAEKESFVVALNFKGERVWKRSLGPFFNQHGHGSGTSPIVYKNFVILSIQQDGQSFVVGLDSKTGKVKWKNERKNRLTGHATPFILEQQGEQPKLFYTNTGDGICCLNPTTGKIIFRANVFKARAVGSPILAGGFVMATCGGGGRGVILPAIPVSSAGNVTTNNAKWVLTKELPYVCTPIAHKGLIYLWGDNGVARCIETNTGKNVWTKRVGGVYSGSPIWIDGKIYAVTRKGECVVVSAAREGKGEILGRTQLSDSSHSTPAVANGQLLIRGFGNLYCLQAKK